MLGICTGSPNALWRTCVPAYLWICGSVDLWICGDVDLWGCGDVGVNYHLLRDFRTGQGDVLDPVLTDTIATRIHQNIVTLETVAQDGRRVRAHAGSGSFRRQKTREECRTEAAQQVRQRREARDDDSSHEARDRRRQAAAQRAATERLQRVEEALQNLAELRQQQEQRKQGSGDAARCSTTAPEARTRKRGDGGFRPAFNVPFATDGGDSRLIVAVEVTNNGSAGGQRAPRHEHVAETDGKVPENDAVDGGFSTNEDLTKVEQRGRKVAAPMTHEDRILKRDGDPHERRQGDRDEMAAFRERLRSADAKAVLKRRPSIAECPNAEFPNAECPNAECRNAECRHRGLRQFKVRGLDKVRTSTRWYVITGNFMRRRHLGVI